MANKKQTKIIDELLDSDLDDEYETNLDILKSKLDEQRKTNDDELESLEFITQDELMAENEINEEQNVEAEFSFSNLDKVKKMSTIDKKLELEKSTNEYLSANNLSIQKIRTIIEATLYVMGNDGMTISDLKRLLDLPQSVLTNIIAQMAIEKEKDVNSGLCIKQFGSKFKILTKTETYDEICKVLNKKEIKPLNKTRLEILSIIAYSQPCTKKFIERIRDKDCTNILASLLELGLINKGIAKDLPGRPRLYTVTQKFFDLFGLRSLNDLPKIDRLSHEAISNLLNNTTEDYEDEHDDEL